jgi:hypothetical protein
MDEEEEEEALLEATEKSTYDMVTQVKINCQQEYRHKHQNFYSLLVREF